MKSIGDSAVLMRHIVSGIVAPPLSSAAVCFAMVFVPKAGERGVRAQRFSDEQPLWFSSAQGGPLPILGAVLFIVLGALVIRLELVRLPHVKVAVESAG